MLLTTPFKLQTRSKHKLFNLYDFFVDFMKAFEILPPHHPIVYVRAYFLLYFIYFRVIYQNLWIVNAFVVRILLELIKILFRVRQKRNYF